MTSIDDTSLAAGRHPTRAGSTNRLAYSVPEAAAATGLGKTTLYALIGNGALTSSKIGGRRLITKADLDALLQQHRTVVADRLAPAK